MYDTILLLFAHWIGDYVLQTNDMANQKASSLQWLTIHVAVYCVPVVGVSLILFPLPTALYYLLANAGLHWLTDLTTGRLANRYRANPRLFYPIIGFDQFFHGACLIVTAELMG